MHADASYVMGQGHRVCQDYARAGRTPQEHPLVYGLVSDGCSSSPDTDVGARLLVLTAERMLWEGAPDRRIAIDPAVVAARAEVQRAAFATVIPPDVLDATLLAVVAAREGSAHLSCCGDGMFAVRGPAVDGEAALRTWSIEAPDGYPRYPNYCNNAVRQLRVQAGAEWVARGSDGSEFHTAQVRGFDRYVARAEVAAVFSDGVRSFLDADRQLVPGEQVVAELMAFRGYAGAFVQRRLHAFLRAAGKRGWRHEDDVAMAAIYLGSEGA